MSNDNPLGERGRALEEEYFRRVERELLDRAQHTAAREEERRELGALTGLQAQDVASLQTLGFTTETVALLPFVPLIAVAWAEGVVTDRERALIVQLARMRGIVDGSAAGRQLASWFAEPPPPDVVASATRLVGAMFERPGTIVAGLTADTLVDYCERIAAASGGVFGLRRVGAEERALLTTIASDLKQRPGRGDEPIGANAGRVSEPAMMDDAASGEDWPPVNVSPHEDGYVFTPVNRVTALFRSMDGVRGAVAELNDLGFGAGTVELFVGEDGAAALDVSGAASGPVTRVLRNVEALMVRSATDSHQQADAVLRAGGVAVAVLLDGREPMKDQVAAVLKRAGGEVVRYWTRWSVESID